MEVTTTTSSKLSLLGNVWEIEPEIEATPDGVVRKILEARGFATPDAQEQFLHPRWPDDVHDPFRFRHMERAVERIARAIRNQELIGMYGDYDADGVCAAAIIASTIESLGGRVETYLPDRETEGYGLNLGAIDQLAERGARVIITGDCGISNLEQIAHARTRGIDVIVTDHHERAVGKDGHEILPEAFAIIHPHVEGETYPREPLSGGGVAFKLAQALLRKLGENTDAQPEKWLLDLVAISSVADVVPLVGEVRTLVHYGLIVLNRTRRPGLKILIESANLAGREINTEDIGFRIAPRINAAGRMNHANAAYLLLVTRDLDEARKLASELETANRDRQKMVEVITREANMQAAAQNSYVIFAQGEDWPIGLLGIVAGRLLDKYQRPAFVATSARGSFRGSGRGPKTWHCTAALREVSHLLAGFGGHARACGFELKDQVPFGDFSSAMEEIGRRTGLETLSPSILKADIRLPCSRLDLDLADALATLAPFGEGNLAPKVAVIGVKVIRASTVGGQGQHLRLMVRDLSGDRAAKFIGFGFGEYAAELTEGKEIDILCEISATTWNGVREPELKIIDLRTNDDA